MDGERKNFISIHNAFWVTTSAVDGSYSSWCGCVLIKAKEDRKEVGKVIEKSHERVGGG